MLNTLIFGEKRDKIDLVYGNGRKEKLASISNLFPQILSTKDLIEKKNELKDIEVIFSTWGMPKLTTEQLKCLPNLKAVFYAAGTVKGFADILLENDIIIVSAWAANAIPVAELASSEILLGLKGFFRNIRDSKNPQIRLNKSCFVGSGIYGEKVAIIGCGQVGRQVIKFLKNHTVELLLCDPYLSHEEAEKLGGRKVTLEEAFREAMVISNHMPNLPETQKLINRDLLQSMRKNAVFINTGRGASVDETALCEILAERDDLSAVLDVTSPEPPQENSPLYTLPNVYMTSHIAGAVNDETQRMADLLFEEYQLWEKGEKLHYQITKEMLATMA